MTGSKRSSPLVVPFAAALLAACSSTSAAPAGDAGVDAAICAAPGGPVVGGQNMRCTADGGAPISQPTSPSSCHPDAGAATLVDAGGGSGYGDTLFNAEGDDDECKYHVKLTSTPLCEGSDVFFTITATNKSDGTPLTGAAPFVQLVFGTHLPPNTPQIAIEAPPGTYKVGPVKLDVAGQWTARFHFYENCDDTVPDSPHGHVAFYLGVP